MRGLKICVVSNRPHQPRFTASLALLMLELGKGTTFPRVGLYIQPNASCLPQGRQNAVTQALKEEYSHLLWLDDDMLFPADTAQRLLAHDKAIVGANYVRKQKPLSWTAKDLEGNERSSLGRRGIEEVSRLGFGVLLTRAAVFQELKEPHFAIEWIGDGNYRGEDAYFCKKARNAGISLYADHDLSFKVRHVGDYAYGCPESSD